MNTEDTLNQALQEIGEKRYDRSQSSEASWPDCWLRRKTCNWCIADLELCWQSLREQCEGQFVTIEAGPLVLQEGIFCAISAFWD